MNLIRLVQDAEGGTRVPVWRRVGLERSGEGWTLSRKGFGAGSAWGTWKTLLEAERYRRSGASSIASRAES